MPRKTNAQEAEEQRKAKEAEERAEWEQAIKDLDYWHPDTPAVTVRDVDAPEALNLPLSSENVKPPPDSHKLFVPREENASFRRVYSREDSSTAQQRAGTSIVSNQSSAFSEGRRVPPLAMNKLSSGRVDNSLRGKSLTAREIGYSWSYPSSVVCVKAQTPRTFSLHRKFVKRNMEDRRNNVNPLFMSSMCEYDDPWTREVSFHTTTC